MLAIKRNENGSFVEMWMDLENCHTGWSQSEREKQLFCINAHIWNLEKWERWTYLQTRNGDRHREQTYKHQGGKGRSGRNWEIALTYMYCLCCCCWLVTKLCLTLCDPMEWSPPGSSVHGIFQARILEWVAVSFSRGSSQPRDQTCVSSTGRWILSHWATREAHILLTLSVK